jgi:hypothetical protein
VADPPFTIGDLAVEVRSKNAGPFWMTLDILLADDADFDFLVQSGVLTRESIGRLYRVDPATVLYFEMRSIRAVKISFPRAVSAGSFSDRDMHAGNAP